MAKDTELNQEKTAKDEQPDFKESQAKSETRQKAEEVQTKNFEEEQQTLKAIDQLSADLLSAAEVATRKSETTALRQGIFDLNAAIQTLKTAATLSVQSEPVAAKVVNEQSDRDCGCGDAVKKCCVQLYISKVKVERTQGIGDTNKLEMIFAVRALDMCGLLPGLTSYMTLDKDAGWTPVHSPIGKFCVPCNGSLAIPLIAEAFETGAILEMRPEYGSAVSQITLSCNCDIVPVQILVPLTGGGTNKKGAVSIEVSGKKVECGCC